MGLQNKIAQYREYKNGVSRGYYIHTYGRSNPLYIRARDRYNATHSRSSAGGGRAGCSQKDTYERIELK